MLFRFLPVLLLVPAACLSQPFNFKISTIAGTSPVNDGGSATQGYLLYPRGVAVDPEGNVYIADYGNHRIRKVATDGSISTVAGTGVLGYSGNGPAFTTRLYYPSYLCYDRGDLVFAEVNRIRRITAAGMLTTVLANTGVIYGLAVDRDGTIYFSEDYSRVRKVTRNGVVSVVAGTGRPGFSGDLGPGPEAQLNFAQGVAVDPSGNVYIADGLRVRKVDTSGIITSLYGRDSSQVNDPLIGTMYALLWAPEGLYVGFYSGVVRVSGSAAQRLTNGLIGFSGDGSALDAAFDYIQGLAAGPDGAIYLADFWNSRVRRMRTGMVQTVAGRDRFGGDGGQAADAIIFAPYRLTFDAAGALVMSDTRNERIRKIATDGTISTVIGTGIRGFTGDGTSNVSTSRINFPLGVGFDPAGSLLFSDSHNNRIRAISSAGAIRTVAGTGVFGFSGDGGPAVAAALGGSRGFAIDRAGNIYVADTGNHRVRRINPAGMITTIAGTGTAGFSGDGGPGNQARLSNPEEVAISPDGEIYFADAGNYRIRKIAANGTISTFAGNGTLRRTGDNVPATMASIQRPAALAFDPSGNLFIVESWGNSVVCVTKQGTFYRIAGSGDPGFTGDDGHAMAATLSNPNAVAIDSKGTIVIGDTDNNRIRRLVPLLPSAVSAVSGDRQSGRPGARLPNPLVARITSAEGIPLRDLPVTFAVASGQATLSAATGRTTATGDASVNVTLGSSTGTVTIRATVQGVPPLLFTLTAEDDTVAAPTMRITQVRSGGPSGAVLPALSNSMWIDVYANLPQGIEALIPKEGSLPTELGGFCLEVEGIQTALRAIDSRRIAGVMPAVNGAEARLRVIAGCGTNSAQASDPFTLPMQPATPELLATGLAGANYAVALTAESEARAGGTITVLAIGLGAEAIALLRVGERALEGEVLPDAAMIGVYRVTVRLPDDIVAGQHSVVLTAGGFDSPAGATLVVQ